MGFIFEESGLSFDFTNSVKADKADRATFHDLSAVDFVVETEANILFIEVKNPDNQFSLNKGIFGGKKNIEKFELLSIDEFSKEYPAFKVTEII